MCLDSWSTFNDCADPKEYLPFEPSGNSCIYVYRRVDVPEVEFPPFCLPVNQQRIADILGKYPRNQLSRLDEPYLYGTSATDMSSMITRAEFHSTRVALMREIRDLRHTVAIVQKETRRAQKRIEDSQQRIEESQQRMEESLRRMVHKK